MKALIINGSHRKYGNTWRFAREVQLAAINCENGSIECQILDLVNYPFEFCNGCLECEETGLCVIDDDFTNIIVPKLVDADMLIFASPVYFNMPSAMMKNFIDRSNCMCQYFADNPKKARLFLVGQTDEVSLTSAKRCFQEYFDIMGFDYESNDIYRIARDSNELVMDISLYNEIKMWF